MARAPKLPRSSRHPIRRRQHTWIDRRSVSRPRRHCGSERLRRGVPRLPIRTGGEEDEGRAGGGDGHLTCIRRLIAIDRLHAFGTFQTAIRLEGCAKCLFQNGHIEKIWESG